MSRLGALLAILAAAGLALILWSGPRARPASSPARAVRATREDCSTRSEANFPGGFTSPRNLIAGPLVFVGGAYTDALTVRKFGGNKFPVLVKAGHVVTVQVRTGTAGLAYGPGPGGTRKLRDTHQRITFAACRPGPPPRRYSPEGPSGSMADGSAVTFWSGFVLTRTPSCVPLDVYIDGARSANRVGLSLGRHCRS